MDKKVELIIEDKVGTIILSNPEKGNAFDLEAAKQLFETALKVSQLTNLKVIVLKGAGKNFSFGGDLVSFQSQGENVSAYLKEVTLYLHQAICLLIKMEKPVVGVIRGVAAGAGLSLASICDIVVAAKTAKFTASYTKVGLTPDGSCTYLLPRLIGLRQTQKLLLLNPVIGATEAVNLGLITEAVNDETLEDESRKIIDSLVKNSVTALGRTKQLLNESFLENLESHLTLESNTISKQVGEPDGKEGVAAFIEKRTPVYN
ncbi:2-(1,2-epoxy-1,2-dihydrophenyl)acetyl-CoA isomerase [Evansella vedderi]|uniref:2-(1,2-epoxy-1,2-dihydrophenyl)acetyl-CoA isomerase n=1 Tax=Evansella vedderi TaxID=38282 RepID=A0ABT9ZZL8_9BACI|nr:enoyl-CoA hydratase-related protein [Evansella vedderi]MDQ0256299.1 2-(1,2-epoxy-1,2-dihydrophenyl)acetyl-CoA isomerase [Evansella vedderi]